MKYIALFILVSLVENIYGQDTTFVKNNYDKFEYRIPMRDGVKLFTSVYVPKDKSKPYPFLINRTPYSVEPYGEKMKPKLGPSAIFMEEKFIFVYQDVRGRFMSEGKYEDVRPFIESKTKKQTDEASDMYDTMDWLLKNIKNNNGKAGVWGISYPGFYASMAALSGHPAIKAVSPQAPVTNWFTGDDFHHNGVPFLFDSFRFYYSFGVQSDSLYTTWPAGVDFHSPDAYHWFLEAGTFKNIKDKYFQDTRKFWNDVAMHPDYDEFWKERDVTHVLKNIKCAVMVVGGLFDAEDCWGTWHTYQSIEKQNPGINNTLVMGPWFHGAWERSEGDYFGDIKFETKTSVWFLANVELPFFRHYLKDDGLPDLPEALIYDAGSNEWNRFAQWPPANTTPLKYYFHNNEILSAEKSSLNNSSDSYTSDPRNPVPFTNEISNKRSREFMIEDQRFADTRPDVLTYATPILENDITIAGPVTADLYISSTGTDADFIVKIIDVYPDTSSEYILNGKTIKLGGFEELIRAETMRARYRNSLENPEALQPGKITEVKFTMPDVMYTFKKGHKIMIQVQSSWFPLTAMNPQQFIDVYHCDKADLLKATQTVYHQENAASGVEFSVMTGGVKQ
jgi:putative CocE/NonD family hydrolase